MRIETQRSCFGLGVFEVQVLWTSYVCMYEGMYVCMNI